MNGVITGASSKQVRVKFFKQYLGIPVNVTCRPKSCAPDKATNSSSVSPNLLKYMRSPRESKAAEGKLVLIVDLSVSL